MIRRAVLFVVAVVAVSAATTVAILGGLFALAVWYDETRPTPTPARSYRAPAPVYQEPARVPAPPLYREPVQVPTAPLYREPSYRWEPAVPSFREQRERDQQEQRLREVERRQEQVERDACRARSGTYLSGFGCSR